MYNVVGDDGNLYPADLNALTEWATSGRLRPDSIILDGATGRRLRADDFLALQPVFARRPQSVAPNRPAPSAVPVFAPLPASEQAMPKAAPRNPNAGRNTAIGCFGLFVVLSLGSCIANMGSQAPSTPAATSTSLNIKRGTPMPMTAEEKKRQAESSRRTSAAQKAMIAEEKADAKRRKEAEEQQRKEERAAAAEAERRAREEFEKDGLVLVLKSVDAKSDEYSTKIHGVIINRTGRQLSYAQVQFNLYDKSGAQVGTAMDNINNLDDGGRWKFEATTVNDNWNTYKFSDMTGL